MQRLIKGAVVVNAVCLALVALYIAIMLPTFNMGFYERQFVRNNTHARIRIEPHDLTVVTRHMLDYMRGRHDDLQIRTYIRGEEVYFFTERAVDHMVDVKKLFTGGRIIAIVCAALLVLTLGVALYFKEYERLFLAIRNAAVAAAAVIALVALIALFSFDFAFTWFHYIFFFFDSETLWRLEWDDRLVNIVPTEFFIAISIRIGVLYVLFLAIMFAGGEFMHRRFASLAQM